MPKTATRYIALLRGINVGGSTMIKMEELRTMFEALGFHNVNSYINSGNLAFDLPSADVLRAKNLVSNLESAIRERFGKAIPVMLRKQTEIHTIIDQNPFAGEFASHKEMHVLFLAEPLPAVKADQLHAAGSLDERFAARESEIYCHLRRGVANSLLGSGKLEKLLGVPVTARNWRTVTKLAEL